MTNWVLRVAYDGSTQVETRAAAADGLMLYEPFIEALEEAIEVFPHQPSVCFRGVAVKLMANYKLDSKLVFSAFTSTTPVANEAWGFMSPSKPGTFFCIQSSGGTDISRLSWYPEQQESLLNDFTVFRVRRKMSKTVRQLLKIQFDVASVTEESTVPLSDDFIVEGAIAFAEQTTFMLHPLASAYVEPFVSRTSEAAGGSGSSERRRLFGAVDDWREGRGSKTLLLAGAAGFGKTSALLTMQLRLQESTASETRAFVVYLPLLEVPDVWAAGALDRHLLAILGFEARHFQQLSQRRQIIVLLDHLDDVAHGRTDLDLLNRNPMLSAQRVALTCSDALLDTLRAASPPSPVLDNAEQWSLLPFDDDDVRTFATKWRAVERSGNDDKFASPEQVLGTLAKAAFLDLHTPAVLAMAADVARWTSEGEFPTDATSYFTSLLFKLLTVDASGLTTALDGFTRIALAIAANASKTVTVAEAIEMLKDPSATEDPPDDVTAKRWLTLVPLRVFDLDDMQSPLSFALPGLAEFLCARKK